MIRVFFDEQEIQPDYIKYLNQQVNPFNEKFELGSTICRTFTLQILNLEKYSVPNRVILYEDNGNQDREHWDRYATLVVDEVNEENLDYTEYFLTDGMTRFNTDLVYDIDQTTAQILENICLGHNIELGDYSFYMNDFVVTWQEEDITEREFISYIAEVNGGYAYIDNLGRLKIDQFKKQPVEKIDINKCSSLRVGAYHKYDRVYIELAEATVYYPETSENDTLYLNPENILFNDTEQYSRENIVQHIYSLVNGLQFYNLKIDDMPINPNVRAGQILSIDTGDFLSTQDEKYILTDEGEKIVVSKGKPLQTIITIDWNYSSMWLGGIELDVRSSSQEETKIIKEEEKRRRLDIRVNRQLGEIRQRVTTNEGEISQIIQDASGLEGYFANASGARYIKLSSEGIRISESAESSYVIINEDGVDFYNDDQVRVASMRANEFDTTWWIYSETRNGNCLNIYRRRTT